MNSGDDENPLRCRWCHPAYVTGRECTIGLTLLGTCAGLALGLPVAKQYFGLFHASMKRIRRTALLTGAIGGTTGYCIAQQEPTVYDPRMNQFRADMRKDVMRGMPPGSNNPLVAIWDASEMLFRDKVNGVTRDEVDELRAHMKELEEEDEARKWSKERTVGRWSARGEANVLHNVIDIEEKLEDGTIKKYQIKQM